MVDGSPRGGRIEMDNVAATTFTTIMEQIYRVEDVAPFDTGRDAAQILLEAANGFGCVPV